MNETVLFTLVMAPILAGLGCLIVKHNFATALFTGLSATAIAVASIWLALNGSLNFSTRDIFGLGLLEIGATLDFLLLFYFSYVALKRKSPLLFLLSMTQIGLLAWLEFFMNHGPRDYPLFTSDNLSSILVLIVSFIGSLICIYALPYMRNHEKHLKLKRSKQPQFFMVLVGFLGAINGLALANDLSLFFLFFELTTLCSFLLIGHDDTAEARKNAFTALWMNCVGGLALLVAAIIFQASAGTLEIRALVSGGSAYGLLPLALVCIAGMVKAAQAPFMKWLLGAMVAPTPTSALLHSSTMVKAGVFLIMRFAPAFAGTSLSIAVSLAGGFTFFAAAVLALGQSNGKKILAYSTISNLGLIIACAAINTGPALAAAAMLMVFHAASKGLLFLCVGSTEQRIHSRDAEDMRGLFAKAPATATLMTLGMLTMILPPFGMLLGKWMAVEAATSNMGLLVLLALGSALTVAYWARWAGLVMAAPPESKIFIEKQSPLRLWPQAALTIGALVLSVSAPWIYANLEQAALPLYAALPGSGSSLFSGAGGSFLVLPFFFCVLAGLLLARLGFKAVRSARNPGAYMAGLPSVEQDSYQGPMNIPVKVAVSNYYFGTICAESKIGPWVNIVAGIGILFVLGAGI